MREPKAGGVSSIRIFISAGDDALAALLDPEAGGRSHVGIGERIRNRQPTVAVDVGHESPGSMEDLARELEDPARRPAVVAFAPDVVVLSVSTELDTPADEFRSRLARAVANLKDRLNAHVLVFNVSSVDPRERERIADPEEDTLVRRIHRLNFALVELSMLEGVSVVDADRLIVELGAADHVVAPLDYSRDAYDALGEEVVRIIADYGFFEQRPLVMQLGNREGSR